MTARLRKRLKEQAQCRTPKAGLGELGKMNVPPDGSEAADMRRRSATITLAYAPLAPPTPATPPAQAVPAKDPLKRSISMILVAGVVDSGPSYRDHENRLHADR
jgi:hypothetical protein